MKLPGMLVFMGVVVFVMLDEAYATDMSNNTYWTCKASDDTQKVWFSKHSSKKIALNKAWDVCKQQSISPANCTTANEWCEYSHDGIIMRSYWSCTAFDRSGARWPGGYHSARDRAIRSARKVCKQSSIVPQTCYVRILTCSNRPFHG